MKRDVSELIKELQDACRCSLYNGIALGNNQVAKHKSLSFSASTSEMETRDTFSSFQRFPSSKRRRRDDKISRKRSWEEILEEAASNLPYMTEREHGQVSRLASILFLGFLLPHSTGDEYFLLQNVSSRDRPFEQQQSTGSKTSETATYADSVNQHIIYMPLDERLESAARKYNVDEIGELDTIVDPNVDLAFDSFISRSLASFVGGRPAHTQEVDMLHLLAMAIHPEPSERSIRQTVSELEKKNSESWTNAKRLMSSSRALCFHINYGHRIKLVQLVAEYLVLPEYKAENSALNAPLFEGALAHLRASLHAFSASALSPYEAHWAQCGLVTIAVQTGMIGIVKEEWDCLLHRIVDDRTNYRCTSHHRIRRPTFSLMTQDKDSFCPHAARGQLLERFLTRLNESRHYAETGFLQHCLASLTDAVEWQVECWTNASTSDDDEDGDDKESNKADTQTTNDSPCMLASLLFAAKPLFYFLQPIINVDDESEEESEESHQRDMLVSCGIQLVHHWDSAIAHEAALLLVLAFCYGPDDMVEDYAGAVFESTKMALNFVLDDSKQGKQQRITSRTEAMLSIDSMVSTFSQKSSQYAEALLSYLLSVDRQKSLKAATKGNDDSQGIAVCRLVATVATASPVATLKHAETLISLAQNKHMSTKARLHLVAALLACRRARFFAGGNEKVEQCICSIVSTDSENGWDLYLIGRHALISGNVEIAQLCYRQAQAMSTSETSFMWLSALEQIAEAEASLSRNAAKGIPLATVRLRSAVSTLDSLSAFAGVSNADFTVQTKVLRLRLDFLDLLTGLRQLTREMRLTGAGPAKYTRPRLHLQNTVKRFNHLATRYLTAYRQHGLFLCQQSRTSLRSLHALCRFVADSARRVFADSLPECSRSEEAQNAINAHTLPKGDASHPMTALMRRLDTLVLKDMDTTMDATIRAALMLELIDGILKAPCPFPRGFTLTTPVPVATMRLTGDPNAVDFMDDAGDTLRTIDCDEIEVSPGSPFNFYVSGKLPESMLARAKLPFCIVLLWYSIGYCGGSSEHENPHEEKQDYENMSTSDVKSDMDYKGRLDTSNIAPTGARLSSAGRFFMQVECQALLDEGLYSIEARIGCRDIRCGEWELPLKNGPQSISIRVSRGRS